MSVRDDCPVCSRTPTDTFCPVCPEQIFRDGRQFGVRLQMAESNYSGTGADLMTCPSCKKDFFVTFRIDAITEVQ
jgi:hypothetical protein